jgi:hypothetical protein
MFTLYQEGIKGCVPLFGKLVLWLDQKRGERPACRDCGAGRGDFSIMTPYLCTP